jgi:predicted ATPase
MTREILGRDEELGLLDAFLDGTDRGVRALVLEGEAGVGKSTLWAAGLASAEQRGFQVLSSRPAEAERGLPHVVLADLLEGVVEEVLPTLSAPRRRALEGALLMDRAPEYELDPRALAVAVRTSFQGLAEERPLVLAVDDIQWVDSSSASALVFALRRLRSERILLLLARRLDESGEGPSVEEALEPDAVERLRVGPLSIGAIHTLLQRRLGRPFARPTLRRLQEISGGNPFYALELARGLDSAGGTVDSLEPFPVPETLERLVGARLAGLGGPTHEALLLIAAHGRPSPARRRRDQSERARAGIRSAGGRALDRRGQIHPSAARVGPLPGVVRGGAARSSWTPRRGRRRSGRARPAPRACLRRA